MVRYISEKSAEKPVIDAMCVLKNERGHYALARYRADGLWYFADDYITGEFEWCEV